MAWLFVVCVVIGVCSAFVLRAKCSGLRLGYGLFCICLIYNLFFITYYMRVLEFDRFFVFRVSAGICQGKHHCRVGGVGWGASALWGNAF